MAENALKIFEFEGNNVRTLVNEENNEFLFVAIDVCKVLEIKNHLAAIAKLDEDERGSLLIDTLGGKQSLAAINESGLYSLILKSRKAEAKKFKKWLTTEVLPSIRKTGSYKMSLDLGNRLVLRKLLLEYDDQVISLENQLQETKPKVNFYDKFIDSAGLYNLQNAARAFGEQPNNFINMLKDKYLFYQGNTLVPYQPYLTQGLFEVKSSIVTKKVCYQTFITTKGMEYFAKKFGLVMPSNSLLFIQ